jgi:membrane protein
MRTKFWKARAGRERNPGTVGDLMTRPAGTCGPASTVTEAAVLLKASDCGAVPVVEDGKAVGVVTDRDLALGLAAHHDLADRPVSEVMSRDVAAVAPDTPLEELGATFAERPRRRVVLVAEDGQVRGLVDWCDLARRLPPRDLKRVVNNLAGRAWVAGPLGTRPPEEPIRARPADPRWWSPRAFWGLLVATYQEWMRDKIPQLGAALAFYTLYSLAPLLLIAIALAGFLFGEDAARGRIMEQIQDLVGREGAEATQNMIAGAHQPTIGSIAALIGLATLLFAASGVFAQLQDSMNTIWEVQPRPGRGIWGTIKDRFLSFVMVLGTGFLLLVSLILSTMVEAFINLAANMMPGITWAVLLGNFAVSFVIFTVLFALIFKVLPDVQIAWRDVAVGSVLTTILFMAGRAVLSIYFARGSFGSTYGAAAGVVILLTWVYYSAQILFFGAEFTKAFADRYGSRIVPSPGAEPVTAEARAHQGLAASATA